MLTLLRKKRTSNSIHMNVIYQGRQHRVLLDTGSDVSILSSKILPDLSLRNHTQKWYAANMSSVPILGKTTVTFEVAGVELEGEFLVSDAIEELIFGADWLDKKDHVFDVIILII